MLLLAEPADLWLAPESRKKAFSPALVCQSYILLNNSTYSCPSKNICILQHDGVAAAKVRRPVMRILVGRRGLGAHRRTHKTGGQSVHWSPVLSSAPHRTNIAQF